MIVIAGRIVIDPAHHDQAKAAANEMMAQTQREPGCIAYVFSADLEDPGTFRLFEEWQSPEDLDKHFATPHMAVFQAAIQQLGVKEVAVQKYEIASVGPVR